MVPVIRSLRPGQLRSVYALSRALKQMDLRHIPLSEDLSPLRLPVRIGSRTVPNAMAVQPLEGFDGMEDGSPSPSVFRRYEAFAASGAGLIWFESVSVSPDGRDAPHQLSITPQNAANFRALAQAADAARVREWGLPPVKILQLTHSGRNSFQTPLTAFHSPYLDPFYPKSLTVLSDHDLDVLSERTYQSAMLAQEAGFDGIDLKFCHNYLFRELLAGFTRPGKYGGSFENRARFLLSLVERIRSAAGPDLLIGVRLNAYDSIPYPYGWGMVQKDGVMQPDLTEPMRLIRLLETMGVRLFNITSMFPRVAPERGGFPAMFRPGAEILPFRGVNALLKATGELKRAAPRSVFVGTGLSWFEGFAPNVGAGGLREGCFDIAGFGRMALAYPEMFSRVLRGQALEHGRCCITCDGCYRCMETGGPVVCTLHRGPSKSSAERTNGNERSGTTG